MFPSSVGIHCAVLVSLAAAFFSSLTLAESQVQFRADFYTRDLQSNTIKGKGNAWLKGEGREVWADSIEFDFNSNKAVANGNVHVKEAGGVEMWSNHITYAMSGEEATLEEATIVTGKLVMTGKVIRKTRFIEYNIEEGTYSNCNIDLTASPNTKDCPFDWKVYGSHFNIVSEGYAHINDALIYIKGLPSFYTPYFIFPVKTQRQSGVLGPRIGYIENLGSSISLPVFFALGPWHDLTVVPTSYSRAGWHVGLLYQYIYSRERFGKANVFLMRRRFGPANNPSPDDNTRPRTMGLFGEWAVDITNRYHFSGRVHSWQVFRMLSNPYYPVEHSQDLALQDGTAALRSQLSITAPGDKWFTAGTTTYFQPLVLSEDEGGDRGSVVTLPSLYLSRLNSELLGKYVSYEVDATLSNYYRPSAYDDIPDVPVINARQIDADPTFDANDYLRTGRRLHIEPRLVGQFPITSGIQFQPVIKAGSLLYHFDSPNPGFYHRAYLDGELPLSLYISKNFNTSIRGFEKIRHIFQPRVIYAWRPLQTAEGNHPFFLNKAGPRFDIIDQVTEFQYMRFELINRLLNRSGNHVGRFFTLQVSEQLNITKSTIDPRFQTGLGPIEILSEARLWRLGASFQALFGLERKGPGLPRESDWSAALAYSSPSDDVVQITSRFVTRADSNLDQEVVYLSFYKRLPIFFDVSGTMEYSLRTHTFGAYRASFFLESKPRSCWGIRFDLGRDGNNRDFIQFDFKFDFGNPNAARL